MSVKTFSVGFYDDMTGPENLIYTARLSALLMCQAMPRECHITTIEKYGKRIPVARRNFKKAGEEGRITLLEGDADVLLKELEGRSFDLVFMDAAKGHWMSPTANLPYSCMPWFR